MNHFSTIVTGAAGCIGRNLVAELNARGENDLLLVDELGSSEKWKNLIGLRYEDIWEPASSCATQTWPRTASGRSGRSSSQRCQPVSGTPDVNILSPSLLRRRSGFI